MELPQNCCENDDFLGISICSAYAPLDECENDFAHTSEDESNDLVEAESSISTELDCYLSLNEEYGFSSFCVRHLSFHTTCKCYHDRGVSEQMWVYFPKILENMANLRHLDLNETIIKELPASIEHLNRLEVLILHSCENLVTLLESIFNLCFLEVLDVSYCSKLHKLPQNLGRLQSLKHLDERGIPTEICHPSSLQHLHLIENLFRSISVGINQLSMLRHLELGHCQELRQIPALSSSLRVLDVHECTRLETSSDIFSMQIPLLWVIQRRKIEPAFK
ncbi:Disease resistance-like protein CSA1 [Vitis vinifera]|uniref:Disease resistance-like protein CSA1 n=1 Tax=Vitis vinifera TaxID=29760 RepID=A0A438HHC7_VITVI|nr:Disease resistance-like protein CSA1 [Vitis vinifera]